MIMNIYTVLTNFERRRTGTAQEKSSDLIHRRSINQSFICSKTYTVTMRIQAHGWEGQWPTLTAAQRTWHITQPLYVSLETRTTVMQW